MKINLRYIYSSVVILLALVGAVQAAPKADIYACPKFPLKNGKLALASGISLYSGHPSELANLKPDNDETDTGFAFWTVGPSEFEYWYVCSYPGTDSKLEFKIPKSYVRCTNFGTGKSRDKLRCE